MKTASTPAPSPACAFTRGGQSVLWEPFSTCAPAGPHLTRNLYKNVAGDKLVFEEVNDALGLTFRYAWRTSDRYGFVRTAWLHNHGGESCTVHLLDGMQNLLPYGATVALQTGMSNLLDAYKRSELDPATGLGIFALSATLTDRAEPSESLKATVAWQVGLAAPTYLLSSAPAWGLPRRPSCDPGRGHQGPPRRVPRQHDAGPCSRRRTELEHRGRRQPGSRRPSPACSTCWRASGRRWPACSSRISPAAPPNCWAWSPPPMASSTRPTSLTTAHHFANVTFNIMRGGIFVGNGHVAKEDLLDFVRVRNRTLLAPNTPSAAFLADLPDSIFVADLYARAAATGVPDLIRLCYEYLPLTFSRRHGDPSRPWNQFSINLRNPDGRRRLDYQGNWRDIFQNWEPLAWSYPMFTLGMIARFLNATTVDGYNPYRVIARRHRVGGSRPRQSLVQHRLLERPPDRLPAKAARSRRPVPARRTGGAARPALSSAMPTYPTAFAPMPPCCATRCSTIDFDRDKQAAIVRRTQELGADGKLVMTPGGQVLHVTLAEKLLVLLLAKLTNLVPEGGIWMNTQRPEWNDANNALVGKGLSVVTAAYLRRYIVFCRRTPCGGRPRLPAQLGGHGTAGRRSLASSKSIRVQLAGAFDPAARRAFMDALGAVAGDYRWLYYHDGLSGEVADVAAGDVLALLDLALAYVDHTLRADRRADGLYHAYNILRLAAGEASVTTLYEMLEGQVAILSSGLLNSDEALALLHTLRGSKLYRADQHSYILYPDRELPGFLRKNQVAAHRWRAWP